jgi:Tfp pilus assembly protein PilN
MRAVNLLPKDDGRAASGGGQNLPLLVGASGAIFVVSLLAAGFMYESGNAQRAQADLASAQAQLTALPAPPPPRSASDEQLFGQQTARLTALQTALSRRVAWDRVLREIAMVLPQDVYLQSLKAQSPASGSTVDPPATPTPTATAQGLTMAGRTYSHDSVARLLSRLEVIPDLTNVQLGDSSQGPTGVNFVINADIRLPGAAA